MTDIRTTWVEAREPASTRRMAAGVEVDLSGLGEAGRVWLFTPDEYDERVWPRRGAEVRDA